jgi:hypothetical protein
LAFFLRGDNINNFLNMIEDLEEIKLRWSRILRGKEFRRVDEEKIENVNAGLLWPTPATTTSHVLKRRAHTVP